MTKIILVSELLAEGLNKTQIAARLGNSRRTVIRWCQAIAEYGSPDAFLEHNHQAKTGTLPTPENRRAAETEALGLARKTPLVLRGNDPIFLSQRLRAEERDDDL